MDYLAPKTVLMYQTRFPVYSILSMFCLVFSCKIAPSRETLPYYNTPDFTPQFISTQDADHQIDHTIGDFSFLDQHGDTITQHHIEGKIHVADFIFTHCFSICPTLTRHMKKIQDAFADRDSIVLLSYSVTPWMDSVAQLKKYALKNQVVSSNWHLLTGEKSKIYSLARKSYFAEEDLGFTKDSSEFLHTEHIILVDDKKKIRGIYNGTLELEIDQLILDIRSMLVH
jgi:protein SCO1